MKWMSMLLLLSAIFVYWDATGHKIGKIQGVSSVSNSSAFGWAIGTILLWIIVFPMYLIKRKVLIEKAKENPVPKGIVTRILFTGTLTICLLVCLSGGCNRLGLQLSKEEVTKLRGYQMTYMSNVGLASLGMTVGGFLDSIKGEKKITGVGSNVTISAGGNSVSLQCDESMSVALVDESQLANIQVLLMQ